MKYFAILALVSILTSFAFTTIEAACADQAVYSSCLNTAQSNINACQPTDFSCLCQAYKNKQLCYNDCPDDTTAQTASQSNSGVTETYCRAIPTTSTTTTSATTTTAATSSSSQSSSPSSSPNNNNSNNNSNGKSDANWIHIAKELVFLPVFVAATFFML